MKTNARLYNCVRCHCQVLICSHCDRGNIYCNSGCSTAARKQEEANKRYNSTPKGRLANGFYYYRAVDKQGNTIDFLLTGKRDKKAALHFLTKVIGRNGKPSLINIDKSGANKASIKQYNINHNKKIKIRQNKYLNNRIEQDHRHIKKLYRATLGFKHFHCAQKTLAGFEVMHMIRKGQMKLKGKINLTPAEQFYLLAA